MLMRTVEVGGAHFSPPTGGRSTQTSPYCAPLALPRPATPSARSFIAVDSLVQWLSASHAFLLRANWRGRYRLQASSPTLPDLQVISIIEEWANSTPADMPGSFTLGTNPELHILWLPLRGQRHSDEALAAVRPSPWTDMELMLGASFAVTLFDP